MDFTDFMHDSGVKQDALGGGSFARVYVSGNANIPNFV